MTPAAGISLISQQSGNILLNQLPSKLKPLFTISLPLSLSKVPAMNQRMPIVQKKLTPKIWNDVISAWIPVGCQLLGVSETQCNITCDRLGLVAVEYDLTLFACGDGVRDPDEQCDDWNERNGDGCDSRCLIEDGWQCQKGSYPAEKYGHDICQRLPCYAPYNCSGMGVCTPLNTCACATGFFGNNCNVSLLVIAQTQLNANATQLPKQLQLSYQGGNTFTLTIPGVTNTSNETVMAAMAVYESGSFPSRPADPVDVPPNSTVTVAPSETVFLSPITDIRIYSKLRLQASALVVLARKFEINRRSTGARINFTLDDPNSNVTLKVMKLNAGGSEWQSVAGTTFSLVSVSSVSFGFPVAENAYYAVFALLPPVYQKQRESTPPPATSTSPSVPELPPDHTAAIVGGVLGGVALIAALAFGVRRWRKTRQQAIVAMYYNAVSKTKGHRPAVPLTPLPQTHLERPEPKVPETGHLERPLSPELPNALQSSAASPSVVRPSIWNAANRYKVSPSQTPPPSQPLQAPQPPPPVVSGGARPSRAANMSHDKSLLAAAIRSKMLRQSPSIRNSRLASALQLGDQVTNSSFNTTANTAISEDGSHFWERQVAAVPTMDLDEIEVQLPAPQVSEIAAQISLDSNDVTSQNTEEGRIASSTNIEVESLSEDATIWRAREQREADDIDVYSTASATSVGLSVFETVTETHSHMTAAEEDPLSVASDQSDDEES